MQVLKEDIRTSILEASLTEFQLKGYDKAAMSAIAARCKISKGNLYHYFLSKEELYNTIMTPAIQELRETARYLTGTEFLDNTFDVMAEIMAKRLCPVVCKYRREILVIMNTVTVDGGQSFKGEMIQCLVECFRTFDPDKMPKNFTYVLASMLIDGICTIIRDNEEKEEIYQQLLALFRYHARGAYAFSEGIRKNIGVKRD